MDVPQTPGKRKRETNVPRITYHVATRTFDRLFKEETLDETKDVVRRKLELPESSNIRLAQLRGENIVDLEDDDDFDAFYAIAHSKMAIDVRVTIETNSSTMGTSASPAVPSRSPPDATALRKRKVTFLEDQNVPPNKRRISLTSSSSPNPTNGATSSEPSEGSPSSPIIITPTTPSTNASENEREPTASEPPPPKPTKTKKKAKITTDAEPIEAEREPSDTNTSDNRANPDPSEQPLKKPPKGKKKAKPTDAEPETEVDSTTVPLEDHNAALPEKPPKTPLKAKKRAKTPATEPEAVGGPTRVPLEQDIPQGETKKKRKRKEKGGEEATNIVPDAITKKAKKSNTQSDTADGGFHQQLVDTINAGNRDATDVAEGAANLESDPPPAKRMKKTSKITSQDPKVPGKVTNGMAETTEQSEGKVKRKRSKSESRKEGERELTADERAAVTKSIMLAVQRAMPASSKTDMISSASKQLAKPQSLRNKVSSSADILAAARNRTASKPSKTVVNLTSTSKSLPVPSKSSLAPPASSESSNDDDDNGATQSVTTPVPPSPLIPDDPDPYSHIDLEAVVRGPTKRRLTLDSVLPLITLSSPRRNAVVLEEDPIVKPKSARRSLAISSDTDEDGDDSTSDKVESEPKNLPSPASVNSSEPSGSGASVAGAEIVPVTTVAPAREPISASSGRSDERIVGTSTQILDPVTPLLVNGQAPDGPDKVGGSGPEDPPSVLQTTPTEEHDPIEPSIPSPRPGSPIEAAIPTTSPPNSGRSTAKIPLKPEMRLPQPRRSTRKGNSQPIMQHEVDVRESVVRLTRSRSKPNVQVPSASLPSVPTRRLRSTPHADQPASTDPSRAVTILEHGSSEAPDNLWTTLNAGPSSTADAESVHGSDELHSSLEEDPDPSAVASDSEAPGVPLFIASESQVDFPYSQFQDLDADTDVGVDTALGSASRLEADSEEEDEVEETITAQPSRRTPTAYRGLSQITDQNKFFTGFMPQSVITSTPKNFNEDMYGPLSQAYDDDEEGSDSGSNSEIEKSHIPKGRRAGNKR